MEALIWLAILGSAAWVFYDARRLDVGRDTSGPRKTSPLIWALGCLLLWIIVFPWYLIKRPSFVAQNSVPAWPTGYPGSQGAASPSSSVSSPTTNAVIVLTAGAGLVLGSFLPWATVVAPLVGTISRSGMDGGDGILTLLLGALAIVAGIRLLQRPATKGESIAVAVVGVLSLLLTLFEWAHVNSVISEATDVSDGLATGSPSAGLWLIGLSSIALLVGAALLSGSADAPTPPRTVAFRPMSSEHQYPTGPSQPGVSAANTHARPQSPPHDLGARTARSHSPDTAANGPAADSVGDRLTANLLQLAEMHDRGDLTDEQFSKAKAVLLGRMSERGVAG